jgi:hypothetical protein
LLSNYVLGINLLKNIALKFADEDTLNNEFDNMMAEIFKTEQILFSQGSVDAPTNFFAETQNEEHDEV